MPVRFGTDGVRGVANADLDPESILTLGRATARVLGAPCFLVGRDTRRSGPLLQQAMSAGMASEGADVIDVGVLSTPALAWLSARRSVPAVMVSASHNAFPDNGIKVLAAGGLKLASASERAIEQEHEMLEREPGARGRPVGEEVGSITSEPEAAEAYVEHLVGLFGGSDLSALGVVIDCANGAAFELAPLTLGRLGVRAHAIGVAPDGTNINHQCGSTHPEALASAVLEGGYDLGLALDGDADRLVAVDHTGSVKTGDELMALFAADLAGRGELEGDAVVVTVLSNLGFKRAMESRGITVVETPVGDRNVLEEMEARGLVLGGEQSGHIIFRRLATTGDGLLSALCLLELLHRARRPLAELVEGAMKRLPQVAANVAVGDPKAAVEAPGVVEELASIERWLGGDGRVLLRVSGTEPLVRVMAEAADEHVAAEAVKRLCEAVQRAGETPAAPRP